MAVTNLTGTKWIMNKQGSHKPISDFSSQYSFICTITATTTSGSVRTFNMTTVYDDIEEDTYTFSSLEDAIFYSDGGYWADMHSSDEYINVQIEVTNGSELATNENFIAFFESNGTQIIDQPMKITTTDGLECAVEYAVKDSKGQKITETYQPKLVSGTNIKTIGGESILGSGNLSVQGLTELPNQYNRITDLDAGVYKLTYNGTKYLYFDGSTSTTTHTVTGGAGSVILVVSKNSTTYWHWYYINGSASYATLYYGYTRKDGGSASSKALNNLLASVPSTYKQVPNSTYADYSLGYFYASSTYGTSAFSLNSTDYLYPGQYSFSLGTSSSTTWGAPYTPASTVRALLITNAPYYTNNTTYRPYVEQEIIVFDTTVRHFKRKWTASSSTFGTWEEEDYQPKLVSGTNIKTINNTSLLGSGNITISGGGESLYLHRLIIYCHKGSDNKGANLSLWFTTNSATPVNSFERLKEIAGAGLYSKIPAVGCYGTTYDFAEAVYNTNNHLVAVWFYSENYLEVDIEDPIEGAFGDLLFNANQVTIGDYVKQL